MTKRKPKIMIWDLENSHIVANTWGLWQQNINTGDIMHDWFLLCGAWKFLGEKKVYTAVPTKKELLAKNDKRIVKEIAAAVESADMLVAHNGDSFDLKKLKTRVLKHNLKPISFIKTVDTLKVARKEFKITSNKLDYIAEFLGLGNKLVNPPRLWNNVESGSMKHLKLMVEYNKVDVTLLEDVYLRLRPHMSNHPDINIFAERGKESREVAFESCKACKSINTQKYGIRYAATKKYQKFLCKACGHVFSNGKSI